MKYITPAIFIGSACFFANAAFADAQCEGPVQDGNTWNLLCAADGTDDADYQCDYMLSLTNADGFTENVEATGGVSTGQREVIIWSAIQNDNADITAATWRAASGPSGLHRFVLE